MRPHDYLSTVLLVLFMIAGFFLEGLHMRAAAQEQTDAGIVVKTEKRR